MTCEHYRRQCHVRAECCREWVACRLCHDAQFTDHEIDRHAIKEMRCDACNTEQPCAQACSRCGTRMAAYFCATCNLFDDDGEQKRVFHCSDCGICRVGGREHFFHCVTCCGCYPLSLRDRHKCLEGSMHRECAICLEVTFASLESVHVLPCGHVLHSGCWQEYINHGHYRCPSCRTRMFWVDDGADGDDSDENEESGDESGDDDESEDEEDSDATRSASGSADSDASTHAQAAGTRVAARSSGASGVTQELVTAILDALTSAADSDSDSDSDEQQEEDDDAIGSAH